MNNYITPRMLSKEEQRELLELFPNSSNKELAKRFNVLQDSLESFARKRGVKKSEEWKQKTKCGQFLKGNVPANKGVKMSKEDYAKRKSTMFKKGCKPINVNNIGHKRLSKDGYIYIKTSNTRLSSGFNSNYELLHRVIWREHNGAIPEGYNVQFKDGDRKNCNIDNLYLISRADQMKNENSPHVKYPKEIVELMQLKGAINRQINKHQSKHE